jgi:hypothetical protein
MKRASECCRALRATLPCLLLATLSCGGGGGQHGAEPGQFSFARTEGLESEATTSASAPAASEVGVLRSALSETSFDLGMLNKSRDYYFLLGNSGGTDITGIAIGSSNNAFVVAPAAIDVLPASGMAVTPIVRVSVIHGLNLNGVGFAPLLPKGPNQADIMVAGTTGGQAVTLTVHLTVDAKVMDVELLDANTAVDLMRPDTSWMVGAYWAPASMRVYIVAQPTLHNIGNVPLEVTTYQDGTASSASTLDPDGTLALSYSAAFQMAVKLTSTAICDPERLQLADNGSAYFAVYQHE